MTTKTCTKCGETKPIVEFYRRGGSQKGLRSKCIQCTRDYYQDNAERIHARNMHHRYGISLREYDGLHF